MNQWYWSKNKQVFGPVEKNEIISLIQDKKLFHFDMLYTDKESCWRPLFQVEEFAPYLGDGKVISDRGTVMQWVLLKKVKVEKGVEYKQVGPFSVEQVLNMLDKGELVFDDLAWKKDFKSWVPISQLEDFKKPLSSSPVFDSDLYEITKNQRETEEISLTDGNIDRYSHEPEMTKTAPINSENFVTESRVNPISSIGTKEGKKFVSSKADNLYPSELAGKPEDLGLGNKNSKLNFCNDNEKHMGQKQTGYKPIEKEKVKYELCETSLNINGPEKKERELKIKKTIDRDKLNKLNNNKIFKLDIDTWQWVAFAVAVISSFVFFYLLF